jgi:hypothetical protein
MCKTKGDVRVVKIKFVYNVYCTLCIEIYSGGQ